MADDSRVGANDSELTSESSPVRAEDPKLTSETSRPRAEGSEVCAGNSEEGAETQRFGPGSSEIGSHCLCRGGQSEICALFRSGSQLNLADQTLAIGTSPDRNLNLTTGHVKDEPAQRPFIRLRIRTVKCDDKAIDGILDRWQLVRELSRHRVRAPDPQVETHRLDGMLRERVALQLMDSFFQRRSENCRNGDIASPRLWATRG
jgi:hypothetical protein